MSLRSYEVVLMQYPEYRAYKMIILSVPPILICLGTFGNLFSLVILTQRSMRRVSSYTYLAVLSVVDTLVLYIGMLRLWIGELTGKDIREQYDWSCKIISAFGYIFSDYSVWLIIAVTVERYLVVCHPLRAQRMCTPKRAAKISVALLLSLLLINTHFFWTVKIVYFEHKGEFFASCDGAASFEALVRTVWPWVDAFMYSFIPFITILIFNALIIWKVLVARHERENLQSTPRRTITLLTRTNNNTHNSSGQVPVNRLSMGIRRVNQDSNRLTVMLLTISFTFLLTTLPMNISMIAISIWPPDPTSIQHIARIKLARTVTEMLMYLNHSINFYLYCATGKKFRENVLRTLCRRVPRNGGPGGSSSVGGGTTWMPSTQHSHSDVAYHMDNTVAAPGGITGNNGSILLKDMESRSQSSGSSQSNKLEHRLG